MTITSDLNGVLQTLKERAYTGDWTMEIEQRPCGIHASFCYEISVDGPDLPTLRACCGIDVVREIYDIERCVDAIQFKSGQMIGLALMGYDRRSV